MTVVQSALRFELSGKRPPVTASGIASINQSGVVFSSEPGRAGYIRYRWGDFTAKGLETLLARIALERAFLQKDARTKLQIIDFIRAEISIKLPKAAQPVEVPIKPRAEIIEPEVMVQIPPPTVPIKLPSLPKPEPPIASKPKQEVAPTSNEENTGLTENDDSETEFTLVPGPVVPTPPFSKLGSDNWLSFGGLVLLLSFLGLSAYAGYEIALFRHRPARMVCALSALFPLITPIVVLLLPDPAEAEAQSIAKENDRYIIHPSSSARNNPTQTELLNGETQLGEAATGVLSEGTSVAVERYNSARVHFSDRFFSEHLSRFYQSAPAQGQTLYIQTAEHSFPVHHISALEPESLKIVYTSGEEWLEQTLEYKLIEEVRVEALT